MNYYGRPILGTERKYWKSELNTSGVFIDELGYKIRMTPVTFKYESTFYFHKEFDNQYAYDILAWDDSDETQINYEVLVDGYNIPNIGILSYNLDYDAIYNENDWLQQNKIHTVKADFELQTYMLKGNSSGFGLVEQCILDFYTLHGINDDVQDYKQIIIEYFN